MKLKYLALFIMINLLGGCAISGTKDLRNFNKDYAENIPTEPLYKIDHISDMKYQIVVYQGSALLSEKTTRASYLTRAGMIAMAKKCEEFQKKVATSQVDWHTDSMGYINVLGFFTCG